jgi:hypothetical protein
MVGDREHWADPRSVTVVIGAVKVTPDVIKQAEALVEEITGYGAYRSRGNDGEMVVGTTKDKLNGTKPERGKGKHE